MDRGDVERFLASHTYRPGTRDSYRRVLLELLEWPGLKDLTAAGLLDFIQNRPGWGNCMQWLALCACKKFLAWLAPGHPATAAKMKRIKARRQRVLNVITALDLLASFDPRTPKGCRDLAIAALGLDTGLRCSEFCRLKMADVDLSARTLQVICKGGQWGMGIFSPEVAQYLREWIAVRQAADGVDEIFVSTRTGRPLTRCGLNCIARKWGQRISLKLSPQDLRRSFATLSTIFGAPSRIVQIAGRWANIDMVEHYTRSLEPVSITPYLPVSKLLK